MTYYDCKKGKDERGERESGYDMLDHYAGCDDGEISEGAVE